MRYPNKHLDPPHRKLNPMKALLDRVVIVPAVNQIEVHPYFTQRPPATSTPRTAS